MSVAQDIQRAMNTTAKQVMADAPYDKSRTGMVVDYDESTNTYSVIVDRVTYEKIPIVNGLRASVNDIVKVVYPTNNISQMYINSICPLDKIKFYLPIDATEIITPNIILYDNVRKSSIGSNATTTSVGWDWENNDGASLSLRSADKVGQEGEFTLHAKNATNYTALTGTPEGLLRWRGNLQLGNPSNNKMVGATVGNNNTSFDIGWDWDNRDGALLALRSVDYVTGNEGAFSLIARDGTQSVSLTGRTNGTLTWGGKFIQTPVRLETEYKTNNYVSKTNFDRITAYKVGNLVIVNGNLGLGGNNYLIGGQSIEIGTIKNMGTVLQPAYQIVPLHGYNYVVNISVAADGKITIYNYGSTLTSNPWVRFNCTLVTSN